MAPMEQQGYQDIQEMAAVGSTDEVAILSSILEVMQLEDGESRAIAFDDSSFLNINPRSQRWR